MRFQLPARRVILAPMLGLALIANFLKWTP